MSDIGFKEKEQLEELKKNLKGMNYKGCYYALKEISKKFKDYTFIFGQSDDIISLLRDGKGDEAYAYSDKEFLVDSDGFVPENADEIDEDDELERYLMRKKNGLKINVELFKNDRTIDVYMNDNPSSFNFEILEDDDFYGLGLVVKI